MGDSSRMINVDKLSSFSDDLVEFLKDRKDLNKLRQCLGDFEALQSSCLTDFNEVQRLIQDYKRKTYECKQKTDEAKSEATLDEVLDRFQDELEEEIQRECLLKEELRKVVDEMNDLELQRISMEERKQILKKSERDELREERKLSMYASVTNIIPELSDSFKISGHIVERGKNVVEEFEFDPTTVSSFDLCNSIWEMINP